MRKSKICVEDCSKCPYVTCNSHPSFVDMTHEISRRELSRVSGKAKSAPKGNTSPRINVLYG